jgi:putative MFS transporter
MIVVGLALFFDLYDVFLAGVIGVVITSSFGLDKTMLPYVISASFAGMFIGATCMGFVADRYGRRFAFFLNLTIYSIFTLLGAFSTNAEFLIATRVLAGVGIGAQLPVSDAYLSEILPAARRGTLIAVAYTIGFIGNPAVALLARVLVPQSPLGIEGWRWLFLLGALGIVIIWFGRKLPESPRWLLTKGRVDEAHAAARHLTNSPDLAAFPPTTRSHVPFSQLFSPVYRGRTLMLSVFQIFQTVGYYGFGTLVPIVLAAKGFSVLSSLTYTTVAFLGYPIGSALSIFIVDRIDRRWLIVATAFFMAVFGIALGFSEVPAAIGVLGILYTLTSNIFSNALHIFQGEIFPTSIRARAAGFTYSLSRASSAVAPFILLPVLRDFGAVAMFVTIAAAMLIVIIDIAVFAPSTTGKTLEEIAT